MKFFITFLLSLFTVCATAQQPVTILKRYNQHYFEDRYNGTREAYLDIKDGTNFYNQIESVRTENFAWPPNAVNATVTNYYIWSYIASNGSFVVTQSVQWKKDPNGLDLTLVNQPLPPGIAPRFPYPHIGTNTESTVYTYTENKGDSLLLIARTQNPVPGLDFSKPWYYRLNAYLNGREYHTGVALSAGGTKLLCINQMELVDGNNVPFLSSGFFDGAYDTGGPIVYLPANPSHVIAVGTAYSAPPIPSQRSILEIHIPEYLIFQR